MELRMNYQEANPSAFEAMLALEQFSSSRKLDKSLYELIKLRSSQLNGCSFCIDMHGKDLQEKGEDFERILMLTAWRTSSIYTDKEKAALELTECVTLIADNGVPDDTYARVKAYFDDEEFISLVMAINTINCWNRLAIATGMSPGCFL